MAPPLSLSEERAQQKQLERAEDAKALASGAKSREQLRAERGAFAFPRVRVRLDKVRSFLPLSTHPPRELTYRDTERLLARLEGTQLVLVGGQAVNFWAEQYLEDEPALRAQGPFTSRDIDFVGDQALVRTCAHRLRCTYKLEDPFAPGPSAGLILFEDEDGVPHPIDFLRTVYGLKTEELVKTSVPVEVLDDEGQVVAVSLRVMSPIFCLESRVHNVVGLPGSYNNDHGRRQLFASILCARVFIRRLLDEKMERAALKSIKRIFALCSEDFEGKLLYEREGIDPFDAVEEDPRLPEKFFTEHLPRMRQQLAWLRRK